MDLSSYAELAVRLVNTCDPAHPDRDDLRDLEALKVLVADRPHLNVRATRNDLDALRQLRAELRKIFTASAEGDGGEAVEMLNALLIQHPSTRRSPGMTASAGTCTSPRVDRWPTSTRRER